MKNEENLRSSVITSLIWKFLERIGTQGIQFIVSIILARLLLPSDYGVVSLLLVFTAIANAFVSGANTAIGAINGIIEALNNIPGVRIGTIGKIGSVGFSDAA